MLLRAVASAARRLELPGSHVLVAVSGGVDSTTLLHALRVLSARLDLKLSVGHVNHGLRGQAADADARFVEALAARLGLEARVARVDPGALRRAGPSRARPTLQEAARRLRHQALRELAEGCGARYVATAHTADDQAETVLLRLLRGTGPTGLAGIPERSPDGLVVRPLLRVPRAQVLRYARRRGLAWREDASNQDPRFARSRLRQHWLPALAAEFNPALLRVLADLAEAQQRENEWIEGCVEELARERFREASDGSLVMAADGWQELPEALGRRLLRHALHRCGAGRDVSRVHLERMLAFLRQGSQGRMGARVELPGALCLERAPAGFRLGRPVADG